MTNKKSGDPVPIYLKLQTKLMLEIESGRLEPGDRIPPENRLADHHGVSIGTVKKAILNLANEGYLYRVQGKGTFVAGTTLRRESLRYYRFLKDFNNPEANLNIEFLGLKKTKGIEHVNRCLKIRHNQALYEIKRLFLFNKKPLIYSLSYLPQKLFVKLDDFSPKQFERVPIYLFLEEKYGLPTIYNQELISSVPAAHEITQLLKVPERSPILFIEMIAFTYKKRPYEYRQSYCITGNNKILREY